MIVHNCTMQILILGKEGLFSFVLFLVHVEQSNINPHKQIASTIRKQLCQGKHHPIHLFQFSNNAIIFRSQFFDMLASWQPGIINFMYRLLLDSHKHCVFDSDCISLGRWPFQLTSLGKCSFSKLDFSDLQIR